jgi:eukaryotic-like serine/threonine-protein kinase
MPMLGELLGARYRVIHVLGSGGFGHTYVVEDMQRPGNPRCVLKHLTFASNDPAMLNQVRRLFQTEAESLEKLGQHDQIPRLLAYFEENCEFYLVQEFIEGHPLSEELAGGQRFPEPQVIDLLQDVLGILTYVHDQGVIHRDIKPDNLIRRHRDGKLVLIDFGAVKTIGIGNAVTEAQNDTSLMSVPIYTSGYGASEQCLGRPRCSSDIYSLGMVGIQALTGMRPSQLPHEFNTCEVVWRDHADVSDALATVLDQMVRYHVSQRYPTATTAREALLAVKASSGQQRTVNSALTVIPDESTSRLDAAAQRAVTPPEKPVWSAAFWNQQIAGWKVLVGAGVAVGVAVLTLGRSNILETTPNATLHGSPEPTIANSPVITDRISTGERLLNTWQLNSPAKQDGIDSLAAGNYSQAIAALETARKTNRSDPETLIYLNNARIGSQPAYQVAIAVPFSSNLVQAMELLRGAAQAQDAVNQRGGLNGVKLKVVIADDGNIPAIAQQIATTLADNSNILGVVGHSNSDTSLAAARVYKSRQLVMISPTSSAVKLSNLDRYVFRTMPSDRMTAQALGNYMMHRLKKRKATVFFNGASEYSQSLKQEFKAALFYNNVEIVQEVDLTSPAFDADTSLQQAISKGSEVLMLVPDSRALDRAFQVIQLNRRRLTLLAGDTAYNPSLLKLVGEQAVGMVVVVPAAVVASPFQQQFAKLWGAQLESSWRTALAYDATQAMISALLKNPTRQGLQRSLAQPTFTANGSQGVIRFLPSGDRKGNVQLMTVVPTQARKNDPPTYRFRPLP